MMKRSEALLFLLLCVNSIVFACDMSAVITVKNIYMSDYQNSVNDVNYGDFSNPVDYLAYVMTGSTSSRDNDGYGVLYYPQEISEIDTANYWYKYVNNVNENNRVFYTGHFFNPNNPQDVFDDAIENIISEEARAVIVMCHARNATANPFAPGNHPFRMDANNCTYTLMHNGFMSNAARTYMINETNLMHPNWYLSHEPNYSGFTNAAYPSCWIDSEVLFNYLMCHIEADNFEVVNGMKIGLKKLEQFMGLSTNVVNFVFSDGERLYTFRSTPLSGKNSAYKLSYKKVDNQFYAIRTGVPTTDEIQLNRGELVMLSRNADPELHPDFLKESISATPNRNRLSLNQVFTRIAQPVSTHPDIGISFDVLEPTIVKVRVYNQKGQMIRRLADVKLFAGKHVITWDGKDNAYRGVATGVYYIEIIRGKHKSINKIVYHKKR